MHRHDQFATLGIAGSELAATNHFARFQALVSADCAGRRMSGTPATQEDLKHVDSAYVVSGFSRTLSESGLLLPRIIDRV
jgi:hypothetical protein